MATARGPDGSGEVSGIAFRRRRLVIIGLRLAVLIAVLATWQFAVGDPKHDGFVLVDEFYVSRPSEVVRSLQRWQDEGVLLSSVWLTFQTTFVGFAIGSAIGLVVGFVLGTSQTTSDVFKPFIVALNSIPRLALVPLFLLWFGLGVSSKIALVAVIVFFLVFMNTYNGVRDVSAQLVDGLRLMQAKPWQIHAKVTLPSAMSWIIAGFQVSVPYALVAAVTGEMLASNRGMGYLVQRSASQFNTAGVFGAIVVMMIMATALSAVVSLVERWLLAWKPQNLRMGTAD